MIAKRRPEFLAVAAVAALLAVAVVPAKGHAQSFSRLDAGRQMVGIETGLQSGLVTSLGYAAGLQVNAVDRVVMPFIQGSLMVAHPDLRDYNVRAGAQTSLVTLGGFDVSLQLGLDVGATSNTIFEATAFRSEAVLLAGYYGRRWFLVGEAGIDHAWMTHIKNSDWYRTYFYPDARDGWYRNTAGVIHAGAKAGVSFANTELVLRVGMNRTEALKTLDLPFYATLGANHRF